VQYNNHQKKYLQTDSSQTKFRFFFLSLRIVNGTITDTFGVKKNTKEVQDLAFLGRKYLEA